MLFAQTGKQTQTTMPAFRCLFFPTVSLLALFRAAESVGRKTASQSGCGCAGGTGLGLASQSREGGGGGGGEGG